MAAEVPTQEPLSFRAGDTVAWTKALDDYSYADGWRLTYYIRGPKSHDITTTADTGGRGFAASITAADSATFPAGSYWLIGRVSDGTSSYTVAEVSLSVLVNFASTSDVQDGYDGRSHARKCRDLLRQMMEGVAPHPEVAYTLFGERSITLMPVDDRLKLLAHYEGMVAAEERAERAARGERTGVYMRFLRPR